MTIYYFARCERMRPMEWTDSGMLVAHGIDQIQRRWYKSRETVVDVLSSLQLALTDDVTSSFVFVKSRGTLL